MSYGASSSGKTFTIVGTSEEPGIIPRSLEYLFRTLPTLPEVPLIKPNASGGISYMTEADWLKDKIDRQILLSKHTNMDCALHKQTYKAMQERLSNELVGLIDQALGPDDVMLNVWVSFAEIYNENIYDLLKPHPCKGQSRQKLCLGNVNGDTYIKDVAAYFKLCKPYSEENDNEDEENEENVEDRLNDEIQQLQLKLKIQQDEMDRAKSESLDLDKTLNEQKKS
ncbi:hypothetical protein RN001_008324 [Aquatica leii]|uniref:Kinesin motor domain-containing protein n=1 Tax=Aquatica leii TaxID=1421715 RepID=A0AAN7PAK9_9COLE|nr:hypothetical protein RN001_008324 [Aquatica leii]